MRRTLMIFALALTLPFTAQAADVKEIVAKANHAVYYQGEDGRAAVKMSIKDEQGRERTREFTILRKDIGSEDGEQKFYVYFSRPADVNKTVFMVWKHPGADDDRWMYLPALDLVKRIAATDERTSFVGSHFFYEDVSGRNPEEDKHELVEETDNFYVIKSTPKKPELVEFSSYKSWIHKTSFIPVKVEFYDASGTKYREGAAEKVENIGGHQTVTVSRMKDLRSGGETVLTYSKVAYDKGLPEDIFTERYLRSAPREYLR
ncbi:MAG: outer membrane lipoprotein-sorting protein [Rhodospirillales bacterium]|nr:outer membrane lipoprotein-sorting protein [Rhodospirillales bacterium]